MTYAPLTRDAWRRISTTEQLSGRSVDGAPTYIKLVKNTGALGTGNISFAHGIAGLTRVVRLFGGVHDAGSQHIPVPFPGITNFQINIRYFNGTNLQAEIGTGWTAGNALSDLWVIIEYLK